MTDEKHSHEDGPFNYCPVKGCDWVRKPGSQMENFESADFYRRMRFCRSLFPNENGNAHAQKTWGDIFEAFDAAIESEAQNED